jgi:hypothetical protein
MDLPKLRQEETKVKFILICSLVTVSRLQAWRIISFSGLGGSSTNPCSACAEAGIFSFHPSVHPADFGLKQKIPGTSYPGIG